MICGINYDNATFDKCLMSLCSRDDSGWIFQRAVAHGFGCYQSTIARLIHHHNVSDNVDDRQRPDKETTLVPDR